VSAAARCEALVVWEASVDAPSVTVLLVLGEVDEAAGRYDDVDKVIRFLVDGHHHEVSWLGTKAVTVTVWGHQADEVVADIAGAAELLETMW